MFITELEIAFTEIEMAPLRSAQSTKGTSQWGDVYLNLVYGRNCWNWISGLID